MGTVILWTRFAVMAAFITQCAANLNLADVLGDESHINRVIQQCEEGTGYFRLDPKVKDEPTSLLDYEPPQFLEAFANPCWLECLPKDKSAVYPGVDEIIHDSLRPQMQLLSQTVAEAKRKWRLRCLPKFYMIGFPKCGTTDTFLKILAHPDVTLMGGKEIRYWSSKSRYENEIYGLERYLDLTDLATQRVLKKIRFQKHSMSLYHPMIFGDGSPGTVFVNKRWTKEIDEQIAAMNASDSMDYAAIELNLTPKYLHHLQPSALMILMLRNPVSMTFSSYKFFHDDPTIEEFHKCTLMAIDILVECEQVYGIEWCTYNIPLSSANTKKYRCKFVLRSLQLGRYYVFIRSWLNYFPLEQFHFVKLEDTFHDKKTMLREIWDFLGLDVTLNSELFSASRLPGVNVNHISIGDMKDETRTILQKFFTPANEELAKITGQEKFLWTKNE